MQISFQAFGTYNQIMIEEDCLPLLEDCRALCEAIEAKFSAFRSTSAIAEIPAQAGIRPIVIDEETFFMLKRAQDFSNLSKGAFDITIRPADRPGRHRERKPSPMHSGWLSKIRTVRC